MRTEGFKCIGRIGGDYIFAQSVFKHRDDLSGVTGCSVHPVSAEEFEWNSDKENVAERLEHCFADLWKTDAELRLNACSGRSRWSGQFQDSYDNELERWVDQVIDTDGIENIMFDSSFCCDASNAFDQMGIEHECTDCSGCGRMFPIAGFDEVFDQEALDAINDYEAGKISYDDAARIIFGE